MEQGKRKKEDHAFHISVSSLLKEERGYTYIELIISLTLLLVFIPAVFFFANNLEKEARFLMGRERLQMEYMAFHTAVMREIPQASRFYSDKKDLIIELPSGESIRYTHQKRQIIRSVREVGEKYFLGRTILLQQVYFSVFIPCEDGVTVDIGLQNWFSKLDLSTFIGKRVNKTDY